jgi:low affinity Fe/Cu permease
MLPDHDVLRSRRPQQGSTEADENRPQETAERRRWIDDRVRGVGPEQGSARGRTAGVLPHASTWKERHWTSRLLHLIGEAASRTATGISAAGAVVVWAVVGVATGFPRWWQTALYSVAGSVTFLMVFVIQHTHERQTAATQRKLDELIRSSARADDNLIAVEEAADEHLQALTDLNHFDRARVADSNIER